MDFLPLRKIPLPGEAERVYDRWVGEIADRLADDGVDRNELTLRILTALFYPERADADPDDPELPAALRLALFQLDPRRVTLESEYYTDVDVERYARVKPVQWLWQMFDRSAAGENVALGVRLRRALAEHAFASVGRNFKAFGGVRFTFGYNLEVGNDVVVHRDVLLDDRGGIRIGDGVAIGDHARVYSHSESLADQRFIDRPRTVLGDGVRVADHATVLAGVHLQDESMLGSMAVATRDVDPGQLALGVPATPKLSRPPVGKRPDAPRTPDPLADPVPAPGPIRPSGADDPSRPSPPRPVDG
jgi:acetyltransferase-like isoleucine patch superfamily enzyme